MKKKSNVMYSFFQESLFALAVFILLVISAVSYNHANSLSRSTDLLIHSYKIQIQLEQLHSYLKDAESGQRGYIITQDTLFLNSYTNCRLKVNQSFDILKKLTKNQPEQQANLNELQHVIYLRFVLLANSLAIISGSDNKHLLSENMLKGKAEMDYIRLQIGKMVLLEMSYFKNHQTKYNHEISISPFITLIFLLFSMLIFILSFHKINKDLIILKKSNEELLISTESIKHAELIGEFCTSIWNLKTKKLIYSDNLYRLLGCDPQSFEPSIENYLEFVHPDDKHIVAAGAENLLVKHKTYMRFYRIIRKDGQVRFFNSMGKFIANDSQNIIHIGVIKDVTEQHLINLTLQKKNYELQQSNEELASFNQIASHDLQEPLRKIQTFISLISESDNLTFSDMSKDYFKRIQTSVNRMRKLIDDLLLFSRINKKDKIFAVTDLNLLLENTKFELSQSIEEKNADIQSVQLPVLKVIPFQIQQLFLNLLSNSLKFCKPGVTPLIKIDCEEIVAKAYPILKTAPDNTYYKISVTDNGLGFEQQYAKQIFIIFNRLFTTAEYLGTGIGLSICKKIVENHSGFIFAEGNSGIGAIFTVFLPAEYS